MMASVEHYRKEWLNLLKDLEKNPQHMRDLAFNSDLKSSKFRSIYWALLLRVLNEDHHSWNEQRSQQRKRYEKLKMEYIKNPHDDEMPNDDPLSQSTQSVWNQYFSDQELFAVIRQDVVRTFPGVDFFRKPIIQNAMINILFYYARECPYMCYRQGMHEILAPILFVMYGDHQALLHFKEISNWNIDATLDCVLNHIYLESDAYSIFFRIMASIGSYYRVSNFVPHNEFGLPNQQNYYPISTQMEVVSQLNLIRDKILAKEDLHLHNYLLKLDIPLHIFGIRWLRLLFGREFSLLDLLSLWDAIFADSDRFELPNYILVAMLIRIRDKLLLNDYSTCMTFLMRYPTNVDVNLILRHALHMQMPKKFDLPSNAFIYCTMKPAASIEATNKQMKNISIKNEKHNNAPKTPVQKTKERIRSTSLDNAAVKIENQITQLQTQNAADSAKLSKLRIGLSDSNRAAMEGYSENSPELMRLELKNAQTIITIAHNRLQTYLTSVRENVTKNSSDELMHAIDGIEEVCSLLDVKFMFPLQMRSTQIDQATEANEQQRKNQYKAINANDDLLQTSIGEDANTLISNQKQNNVLELNPFDMDEKLQLTNENGAVAKEMMPPTNYEKPDNGYKFNTSRILGNLKEIELIPIITDEIGIEPFNPINS